MLYLFDLDDTLVRTGDLQQHRTAGVNNTSPTYKAELKALLSRRSDRAIWSEHDILKLMSLSPLSNKTANSVGVFTRAPRSYANAVLDSFYKNIKWNAVICYEDVRPYFKPHGHGIKLAREATGEDDVFVIGNDAGDIKAAYHAVCYTAWDKSERSYEAWNLLPDFVYSTPLQLLAMLEEPERHMMPLEAPRSSENSVTPAIATSRSVGLFCEDNQRHMVRVLGRHFSRYAPIRAIRAAHELTIEVERYKSATEFPTAWVSALIDACRDQLQFFGRRRPLGRVILTCIPPRPGRPHRLGALVEQCEARYRAQYGKDRVIFDPAVFNFLPGVRSNSNDHLGRAERFENIANHLSLSAANLRDQDTVIVVDDVVTSGSTLIGAKRLLESGGVSGIQLLGISKNIGDIMPDQWKGEELYDAE
jgi:hypothetical protein